MLLAFAGMTAPVSLDGCDELADAIGRVLRGWPVERLSASATPPIITITKARQGYRRFSPWTAGELTLAHPVDAVCDFLVDLTRAFIMDDPRTLCLHCAAVETDGGLVVFPSTYAAGKSTLAMHLAAAGARLFADDVMPLRRGDRFGIAPGILPRLRLPLAPETRRVLGPFLKSREAAHSRHFAYYAMTQAELAPHGTTRPIAGLVLLERQKLGKARLDEAGAAEMLKSTIIRNFSKSVPGIAVLDCLNAVVGDARRCRLTYASAEDAVDILREAFPFPGGQ